MASRDKGQNEKKDDSVKSELIHRLKTHPYVFIGTVIVLIIVIISFVLVPAIVPSSRGGGELIFGYYKRVPIKYIPNNFFSQTLQALSQSQRPSQSESESRTQVYRIWRQAFEEAAIHTGILEEMRLAGFLVPADMVDRDMAELALFKENGRFSSAKYRSMDNNTRMNLWKQVKETTIIQAYLSDIDSLKTASKESSFVASMANPQRAFDVAIFSLSSYPLSAVEDYAKINPVLFQNIQLSMITTGSERESRQVLNSVKSGSITFEEAARTSSKDWAADRGGDMGEWMVATLSYVLRDEKIRDEILGLAKGELSDVYKLAEGWVFFRVNETAYPMDLTNRDSVEQVRQFISLNQRGIIEDWAAGEAEKFKAQAEKIGFPEAAIQGQVTNRRMGPISLNYGNATLFPSLTSAGVSELENASKDLFFWRAAFNTPLNSFSNPLVLGEYVFIIHPREETFLDEEEIGYIDSYYPYWLRSNTGDAFRSFFLGEERLDDRFHATFSTQIWREY